MSDQIDRLSAVFESFRVRARWFHHGPLCGVRRFDALPGGGYLHVLRHGSLQLAHPPAIGGGRLLRVERPSLLFYPHGHAHDFRHAPRSESDFTCARLEFTFGEGHPIVSALPPFLLLPLEELDGIEYTLALLQAEMERLRCGQRLLADRLFEVLLLQVLRELLDRPSAQLPEVGLLAGLGDRRLARALTAVHETPERDWSLPLLAAQAGMSRSAFAARFSKLVGQSPAKYLGNWRLGLAKLRLAEGQPVPVVAQMLGYASAASLVRAFRQTFGYPPRQWLRQCRQESELV